MLWLTEISATTRTGIMLRRLAAPDAPRSRGRFHLRFWRGVVHAVFVYGEVYVTR